MTKKQQEAIINALEYLMVQVSDPDSMTPRELIDDVKKAFDPTYETHHERMMEGIDEVRKVFPNGIGQHIPDGCDICQAN